MCSSLAAAAASWSLDLAEMLIDVSNYQIPTSYFISAKPHYFIHSHFGRGGTCKCLLSVPVALKGASTHKRHLSRGCSGNL